MLDYWLSCWKMFLGFCSLLSTAFARIEIKIVLSNKAMFARGQYTGRFPASIDLFMFKLPKAGNLPACWLCVWTWIKRIQYLWFHISNKHRGKFLLVAVYISVCSCYSPNGRPAVLRQVLLVLRMKGSQQFGRHLAQLVVVDTEMIHAPVSQLICIVELEQVTEKLLTTFSKMTSKGSRYI